MDWVSGRVEGVVGIATMPIVTRAARVCPPRCIYRRDHHFVSLTAAIILFIAA